MLLERWVDGGTGGSMGRLLGYAEGFGRTDALDAVQGCLEDAKILPQAVGSVRVAWVHDWPALMGALRQAGVTATIGRSPLSGLHSASFPVAIAEATQQPTHERPVPVLVVGTDCLAGAAAVVVLGGA